MLKNIIEKLNIFSSKIKVKCSVCGTDMIVPRPCKFAIYIQSYTAGFICESCQEKLKKEN